MKWKLIVIFGLIMFGMVFTIRGSDMEINRLTQGFVLGQETSGSSSNSFISSSGNIWTFEKIKEDLNVDVNISAINSSVIEITLFEKPISNLANSYKWDLVLINLSSSSGLKYQNEDAKGGFDNAFPINVNYDLITNYGVNETWGDKNNDYGYILFSSGSKNQLPKKLRLIVPEDLKDFELYFGKGSVLITASALDTGNIKGEMLIRAMNGWLHSGFSDNLDDAWYTNSSDDGNTWTTRELVDAITLQSGVNLVQLPNGTLYYIRTNSGDVIMRSSSNNGVTFSADRTLLSSALTANHLACVADNNNMVHCCTTLAGGDPDTTYYVNLTGVAVQLDPEEMFSNQDGGQCDIEVDNNNIPYIVEIDEDLSNPGASDVEIFSPAIKTGWSESNEVFIINQSGTSTYDNVDLAMSNMNRMAISFHNTSGVGSLMFCNSTTSLANTLWNCKTIDALSSDESSIAFGFNDNIAILYNNETLTNVNDIYLASSTDLGATWINRTRQNSGFLPIIQDSHFPRWNRLGTELKYTFVNLTSADLVYDRIASTYNSTFTYVYNGTTLTNHSYSGGVLEGLEYFISDFDYLLMNASWWIPARPSSLNASYTSQIIDAGSSVIWNNISWNQEVCYQCEIPNNTEVNSNKLEKGNLISPLNITGLVGLWHLNNNTNDSSGLGNAGVPNGSINCGSTVDGYFGTACNSGGQGSNFVSLGQPSHLNITGAMTVSAWVNLNSTAINNHGIVSKFGTSPQRGWELVLDDDPNNNLIMRISSSGTDFIDARQGSQFTVDEWIHVAGTYDPGKSLKVYRDGILVGVNTTFVPTSQFNSNNDVRIGTRGFNPSTASFNGTIDEVAIWNRTLSADEISNLYKRGALRLNISVQSCNDASCSGESFRDYTNTSTSINLTEASNRYFQYRFNFNTSNGNFTPKLYNVSLFYTPIVSEVTTVNQCDPLASKGGVSNVINCNLCLEPNRTVTNMAGNNLWFNSSGCGKPGCNVEFNLTNYKMLTINGLSVDACMVRLWTGGG